MYTHMESHSLPGEITGEEEGGERKEEGRTRIVYVSSTASCTTVDSLGGGSERVTHLSNERKRRELRGISVK